MLFLAAVRAEWTKMRTLPATRRILLAAASLTMVLGVLHRSGEGRHGYALLQLLLGVLGILSVTSEYAGGMIRTSLAAVPKRGLLLGAKATVCSTASFAIGAVAGLGAGIYLALIGLAGVATGFLARSTAAAHLLLVTAAFGGPVAGAMLPAPFDQLAQRYWPTATGAQLLGAHQDPHALPSWTGLGLLAAVVAVTLVSAFLVFRGREY